MSCHSCLSKRKQYVLSNNNYPFTMPLPIVSRLMTDGFARSSIDMLVLNIHLRVTPKGNQLRILSARVWRTRAILELNSYIVFTIFSPIISINKRPCRAFFSGQLTVPSPCQLQSTVINDSLVLEIAVSQGGILTV